MHPVTQQWTDKVTCDVIDPVKHSSMKGSLTKRSMESSLVPCLSEIPLLLTFTRNFSWRQALEKTLFFGAVLKYVFFLLSKPGDLIGLTYFGGSYFGMGSQGIGKNLRRIRLNVFCVWKMPVVTIPSFSDILNLILASETLHITT